jgi:hypothetical protein
MLGIFLLSLVIGFYAFVGYAPKELVQAVLAMTWVLMAVSIPVLTVIAMLR